MCTTTAAFNSASSADSGPDVLPTTEELDELLRMALASSAPMNKYRTELLRVARDDVPSARRLHAKLSAVAAVAVLAGDGPRSLPCVGHLTVELLSSQLTVRGDEVCVARTLDRATRFAAGRPESSSGTLGEVTDWVQAVAVAYAFARYIRKG